MEGVSYFLFFSLGAALYLLPTLVAGTRKHPQSGAIFMLNLFAGWTFIGWVGAMVWAALAWRLLLFAQTQQRAECPARPWPCPPTTPWPRRAAPAGTLGSLRRGSEPPPPATAPEARPSRSAAGAPSPKPGSSGANPPPAAPLKSRDRRQGADGTPAAEAGPRPAPSWPKAAAPSRTAGRAPSEEVGPPSVQQPPSKQTRRKHHVADALSVSVVQKLRRAVLKGGKIQFAHPVPGHDAQQVGRNLRQAVDVLVGGVVVHGRAR